MGGRDYLSTILNVVRAGIYLSFRNDVEASQHYCINLVNKWMSRFSNAVFVQIECVCVYVYYMYIGECLIW